MYMISALFLACFFMCSGVISVYSGYPAYVVLICIAASLISGAIAEYQYVKLKGAVEDLSIAIASLFNLEDQ